MAQVHDICRFDASWSHVEVESAEEAERALSVLQAYQLEAADRADSSDGRLAVRTITFREATGRDRLTIWYHRLGSYQLRLELPGLAVTLADCEMRHVVDSARRFFEGPREALFSELMQIECATVRADFPGFLRTLRKGKSRA